MADDRVGDRCWAKADLIGQGAAWIRCRLRHWAPEGDKVVVEINDNDVGPEHQGAAMERAIGSINFNDEQPPGP